MKPLTPLNQAGIKKTTQNTNPNLFSLEVYFLQGVLQLILERLRMLCKLDSAAFGQLSGKGAGRKGTASRQAEVWDIADKALKTLMPTT